jgi:hypothetical protein
VRFEAANHIAGVKGLTGQVAQYIPLGGQDQANVVAGAGCQRLPGAEPPLEQFSEPPLGQPSESPLTANWLHSQGYS